jgi:hypothetical protein
LVAKLLLFARLVLIACGVGGVKRRGKADQRRGRQYSPL